MPVCSTVSEDPTPETVSEPVEPVSRAIAIPPPPLAASCSVSVGHVCSGPVPSMYPSIAAYALTRSLWAPYLRRLRLEAEARRVRAIEEEQLKMGREEAEKEIAAHLDPRERTREPQEEPPVQRIEPRS